jgi:hypothetical protein
MYAGGYLNLSENMIGHEAINLVETDKDENGNKHRFIWLNANGKCSKENIEGKGDSIILLVRNVDEPGVVQVIARAKVKNNKVLDGMDSQSRYLRESQQPRELMYYGGKNVYDIFASNRIGHKGEEDTYATFEVEDFRIPKDEMFLTDAKGKNIERDNVYSIRTEKTDHFAKSSLRQFIEYNVAPKYMEDNLWLGYGDISDARKKLFGKIENDVQLTPASQVSLFDIIGDTYHELSYSNFLAYFLNQKGILREFAKEVLKIDDLGVENCIISREEYNIDILIQSSKYVIVIENKIKSGITEGVKDTTIKKQIEKMFKEENDSKELERKFLEKYGGYTYRMSEKSEKEYKLNDILNETEGVSQLSKYYLYAQKIADGRDIRCFVLAPNYHINSLEKEKYFYGNEYETLGYSKLKTFFEGYNKKNQNSVRFMQDYIDAIEPHSKSFDNYLEDKLLQRFRNAIGNDKTDEERKILNKQLSFSVFQKIRPEIKDELLAKYVMLLRVKHLMLNGDNENNDKTIEYFSLTEEEIKDKIAVAGFKYLKKHKKESYAQLSEEKVEFICNYAYLNCKIKFHDDIYLKQKNIKRIEDMSQEEIIQCCYNIGNQSRCMDELHEVFKDYIHNKRDFKMNIPKQKEGADLLETIKKMIKSKLNEEINNAIDIHKKIKQK